MHKGDCVPSVCVWFQGVDKPAVQTEDLAGRCHQAHLGVRYRGLILTQHQGVLKGRPVSLHLDAARFHSLITLWGTLHAQSAAIYTSCQLTNILRNRLQSCPFAWDSKKILWEEQIPFMIFSNDTKRRAGFLCLVWVWGCSNRGRQDSASDLLWASVNSWGKATVHWIVSASSSKEEQGD